MKKWMMTFLMYMCLLTPAMSAPTEKIQDLNHIVVKVNGMVCDVCAQSVKKLMMKEESVAGVDINLDNGEVDINLKQGQTLTDEQIKKIIDFSGYDVVSITR